MILESVSLFLDEFSDPISDAIAFLSEILNGYKRGLLSRREFYALYRNLLLKLPRSESYAKNIRGLNELLLKLTENPKTKYTVVREKHAKLYLTRFALKSVVIQGSCLERYKRAKELEKKLKELGIHDATTLVRLYLSLALTYSSIGLFDESLKSIAKALRIASFSVNFLEVLFALDTILQRYFEAPRLSDEERMEIQKMRAVAKDLVKLFKGEPDDQEMALKYLGRIFSQALRNSNSAQRRLLCELKQVLLRYLRLFASRASRP